MNYDKTNIQVANIATPETELRRLLNMLSNEVDITSSTTDKIESAGHRLRDTSEPKSDGAIGEKIPFRGLLSELEYQISKLMLINEKLDSNTMKILNLI